MQEYWLERTELLVGKEKLEKLKTKHVLIVGLGGVGAYAAEMICRAGVGKLTLVDGDTVNKSNINRQLPALHSNLGISKAELMGIRLRDINPDLELTLVAKFVKDQDIQDILSVHFDYVVDAIDTLSPKIYLIYRSLLRGINIVSSMGAGGKLDPSLIQMADISESYNCKLARILRKRLRKLGVEKGFPVIFSPEEVDPKAVIVTPDDLNKKSNVGTISYMPSMFGMFCASKVIRDLLNT